MKRPGTQTAAVCSATAKMGQHHMMTATTMTTMAVMRCGADDDEVDDSLAKQRMLAR